MAGKKKSRKKKNKDSLMVSACMMVKNEEEMLPRCLNSIKHLMDEIIIVDTGSTDRTVEIAKSFGAKIYFHPWENNFSKHRNQSISYATGDWLFFIDADEELVAHNLSKDRLKQFLKKLPQNIHAVAVTLKDIKKNGQISQTFTIPKLFKNGVGFHYAGIVHNNPEIKGDVISLDIVVKHYGYDLDEEHMERKFDRTSSLLLKRIDENPEDVAAYYYLCNLHGFRSNPNDGDANKTIEYGKKCLELLSHDKHQKVPCYDALYRVIGKAYANQKDLNDALKWYRKGLEILPDDPDLNFEVCAVGASTQDYELVLEGGLKYLEVAEKFRSSPHLAHGRILYSLDKKYEKAAQYNVITAYLGLRRIEDAEERWEIVKDVIMAKYSMQEEYLKNLSATGYGELLLERTILFLKKNPDAISLVEPLILYCIRESSFKQAYHQLKNDLKDSDAFEALASYTGRLLVKNGAYQIAVEVLEPYYDPTAAESDLLVNLALAYEKSDVRDRAEQVYLNGIESGIDNDEFLNNALNFFKQIGNLTALASGVSALLKKYPGFQDIPDDILLFLAEYFLKTNRMDHFRDVSFTLFERSNIDIVQELKDKDEIAAGYASISGIYEKNGQRPFALQCLNVAWLLTLSPYYLVRMGDVYLAIKQPSRAVEYYQLALNKNYLSLDVLDNMSTALNLLGNQEGLELCNRLRLTVTDQIKA